MDADAWRQGSATWNGPADRPDRLHLPDPYCVTGAEAADVHAVVPSRIDPRCQHHAGVGEDLDDRAVDENPELQWLVRLQYKRPAGALRNGFRAIHMLMYRRIQTPPAAIDAKRACSPITDNPGLLLEIC